jgi:hypothetical protein
MHRILELFVMGKKDNRRTRKMNRLRGQRKKKAALANKIRTAQEAKAGKAPSVASKGAAKAAPKPKKPVAAQ